MRRLPSILLLAALGAGLADVAHARTGAKPRPVVAFDDAAGDADGPGTYVPPGDSEFQDGDFDLRRFEVLVDGDDLVLEVTLGARIRRPATTQRTNATPLELSNGIYLQNVDVYVDTDRTPGSGFSSCIPGRRIAFADGRTWEAAVVLTPQPGAAAAVVQSAMGAAASRVFFAEGIVSRGRTLVARVPVSFLGGVPRDDWGWSVQISGARWERSYQATSKEPDAYTMPVTTVREAWAFGGAPKGEVHPRVVDVLLPPGVDQHAVLGSFDPASGAFARVPFVEARRSPAAPSAPAAAAGEPPTAAAPSLRIVDVSGDVVTVSGPVEGLVPLQIGRVLGEDGATVARVVVARVVGGGLVANVVEGREKVARGARVAFDPPPAAPPSP